jgi:hypothetical protein
MTGYDEVGTYRFRPLNGRETKEEKLQNDFECMSRIAEISKEMCAHHRARADIMERQIKEFLTALKEIARCNRACAECVNAAKAAIAKAEGRA